MSNHDGPHPKDILIQGTPTSPIFDKSNGSYSDIAPNISYAAFFCNVMHLEPHLQTYRFASAVAGLYLFRDSPEKLKRLLHHHPSMLGTAEAAGVDHVMSVLQSCLELYFAQNWDAMDAVMAVNNAQRKDLGEQVDAELSMSTSDREDEAASEMNIPVPKEATVLVYFYAEIIPCSISICNEVILPMFADLDPTAYHLRVFNGASHHHRVREFPRLEVWRPDGTKNHYPLDEWTLENVKRWVESGGHSPLPAASPTFGRTRRLTTVPKEQHFLSPLHIRQQTSNALKEQMLGCTNVVQCKMMTRKSSVRDPPVAVFLGGGVAAGKSTAVAGLQRTDFWRRHGQETVVIDADAFKVRDPAFASQYLSDVHQRSVDDATDLFAKSVEYGRDLVFDGTLQWLPFVEQCIKVVRDERLTYRATQDAKGHKDERYFEVVGPRNELRVPYSLRLVAVTVDPALAVQRAILRALETGRKVPIRALLLSHKRFSEHFVKYLEMFDEVILYDNNVKVELNNGESPPVIVRKDGKCQAPQVCDPIAYEAFLRQAQLNENAKGKADLFSRTKCETEN